VKLAAFGGEVFRCKPEIEGATHLGASIIDDG
jgi:hypothetical protein